MVAMSRLGGMMLVALLLGAGTASQSPSISTAADQAVRTTMARDHIPGAVLVVIEKGRAVLVRGYGVTDLRSKQPVDPARTLFRVGSISKLFTALAVMRQVERGRLSLDGDIRGTVETPLRLPKGMVTLRALLSHRAGFEEGVKDLFPPDARALTALGPYLATHQPAQVRSPGLYPAYSNYGAALAGQAFERAVALPFPQAMQRDVLAPLGMARSTFLQPLPPPWQSFAATGYQGVPLRPLGFVRVQPIPAGGLSTTADDMRRFLLALVGAPPPGSALPVRRATLAAMEAAAWHDAPDEAGMGLAFQRTFRNGTLIVGHDGDLRAFGSALRVVPSQGTAIFVSFSASPKGNAADAVADAAIIAALGPPRTRPAIVPPRGGPSPAGRYVNARRWQAGPLLLAGLVRPVTVVRAGPDGTLSIIGGKAPSHWTPVAATATTVSYAERSGVRTLTAERLPDGNTILRPEPHITFEPIDWAHDPAWQLPILIGLAAAATAITLVLGIRRRRAAPYWAVLLTGSTLLVATMACCAALLLYAADPTHISALSDTNDGWLIMLYAAAVASAVGATASVGAIVRGWNLATRAQHVTQVAVLLVLATGLAEFADWRLFSFVMVY